MKPASPSNENAWPQAARWRHALLLSALLAAAAGCAGPRSSGSSGGGAAIDEIHLFGVPAALNLDGKPGPDGIGVRVFVTSAGLAKGVEMRRGRLDVLLFDGTVTAGRFRDTPPLKTWSFDPAQLAPLARSSALGVGYELALNWSPAHPRFRVVTVLARYHPPTGGDLYSAASTISVGPH